MKNIIGAHNPHRKLEGRLLGTMLFTKRQEIVDKRILNIGCGFGWFELRAAKLGAKNITGIEVSESDLKVAKSNIKNSKVNFEVASAIDLPFKDNAFDTVVIWEVIEHIPKNTEEKMFAEISRVLKNNGTLLLSTPSRHFLTKILDPAWWLIGHRHYHASDIVQLSRKHFSIVYYCYKGKWYTVIGLLNMYISKWIFRREPFFSEFISEKVSGEYKLNDGFANLFIRLKNEK